MFILKKFKKYNEEVKHVKTIKKAIALVLTALMVLSLVPAGVSARPSAGMTLSEFQAELTPRMESFYANITPEQATILKAMGDSLNTSTLSPYTTVDAAWTTILGGLVTPTLVTKYGSTQAAATVLAKMVYSTMELMFYMDTAAGTDSAKLEAAITNAYNNLYLPMDELAGYSFTQAALSSILSDVKGTISSQLSSYANAITNAMNASATTTYVNTIANSIASVAVTNLFNNAAAGSTLETLKNNFATNAGFTTTDLGTLVKKIYVATASVSSAQKAPAVQFNLLINTVITFQGAKKDTSPVVVLPFDQAISLSSATEEEVSFKVNPNRTIAGIDLDMTSYFEVSSPDNAIISATKVEDLVYGGYYIKLKAMPNVTNGGTYYVSVYRKSVAGENYFFNIKVDFVGIGLPPVDKTALTSAIDTATTLIGSKTVGTAVGNVPQSAKTAFQTAIDNATAVKNNANSAQNDVDNAVIALATATTAFTNSVITVAPGNILVKKVGDANFSMTFETIALATAYVKLQADAVKGNNSVNAVNYYAVSKDGITPIANKNTNMSKIIVSGELSSQEIPNGAVIWVSTNPGSTPVISNTDYYTKGINALNTIQGAIDAAPIGAEIVIKDGTYNENVTVNKQLNIRNGSSVQITGAMIMAAAAAGTVIAGITITSVGGTISSITVNAPNITIENLILNDAVIVVDAPNTIIQNVTATNPPVGTPVITVNATANDTTISDFSFTEVGAAPGAAITVAAGVTGTAVTNSLVVGADPVVVLPANSTIQFASPVTQTSMAYIPAVVPPKVSNIPGVETNVELKIRNVATANGTIKAIAYLTGIDANKGIDAGHAVVGYSFKTLKNPVVTACSSYTIVNPTTLNLNEGTLEVAYSSIGGTNPAHPSLADLDGDGTAETLTLDLFDITFPPLANSAPDDVYRIWLSKTSPNNELISSIKTSAGAGSGDQYIPYPMIYTTSSDYIWIPVPNLTLTLHIELPYVVKNNPSYGQQRFKVKIQEVGKVPTEIFEIYTGANADPNSKHTGATLVALDSTGAVLTTPDVDAYVSEYVLTLPGFAKDTQYDVTFIGDGYATYTTRAILNNNLSVTVFNDIRSITHDTFLAGDINGTSSAITGPVDDGDFTAMASNYGYTGLDQTMIKYDINRDHKVGILDIAYLINNMKGYRISY